MTAAQPILANRPRPAARTAAGDVAPMPAMQPHAAALAAAARREAWSTLLLAGPALLLVTVILFLPVGWLFWQSVVGPEGVTLQNYARLADRAYALTLRRTFEIAVQVTLLCIALGYPLAYVMATLRGRWTALVMACVLLPFWTSILVRTYAWLVLLQRRGVINDWLIDMGLIERPLRLVYNMTGTLIGMTHILLPFMVLPLYAAMKAIDTDLVRAAAMCGARPDQAFRHVFLPLSVPGLVAGSVVVFVLCLGFYVTPAVLGGGRVVMWAMQIEDQVSLQASWGPAAAMGVALLVVTLGLLWAVSRAFRGAGLGRL